MKMKYGNIVAIGLGAVLFVTSCGGSGASRSSAIGRHAVNVAQESGPQGRYKPGPRFEKQLSEMISKEVKALGFDTTKEGGKEGVPMEINREVLVNINYFANERRNFIVNSLSRGSKFIPMMKDIFRKKGLPEDLVYLAVIESGFQTHAVSTASAVGPWQFIASTGRRYNLTIDEWVDERNDPVKSTYAAADYLNTLHDMFNSWPLAVAAYNSGEGKIKRGMDNYGVNDFWDMSNVSGHLANETKLYVPSFLAVIFIAKDPGAYGISYDKQPLYKWDEVVVGSPIDLKTAAELCGSNLETLKELNPHLKKAVTPPNARNFVLRVPEGSQKKFNKAYAKLPKDRLAAISASATKGGGGDTTVHVVKKGETVASIARKYGVTSAQIKTLNRLKTDKPKVGGRIKIPVVSSSYSAKSPALGSYEREIVSYIVQPGDTKSGLSAQFGLPWSEIAEINGFNSNYKLVSGKMIKVPQKSSKKVKTVKAGADSAEWMSGTTKNTGSVERQTQQSVKTHTVAKGETLGSIAMKYKMSVKDLARINNISGTNIRLGQKLKIQAQPSASVTVPDKSADATTEVKARESRLVSGTHTVSKGETLGGIAAKYKMSVKDLSELNNISGSGIRVGQKLKVQSPAKVKEDKSPEAARSAPEKVQAPVERPSAGGLKTHKVSQGETLGAIASKYKMSAKDLAAINNIKGSNIRVGQVLKLQSSAAAVSSEGDNKTGAQIKSVKIKAGASYTVESGDTLYSIAKSYGLSTDELLSLNPQISGSSIRMGQKINVPARAKKKSSTPTSAPSNEAKNKASSQSPSTYKVGDGDTLYSIAKKHKLSVDQLKKINNLRVDTVRPGQTLKLK